MNKLRSNCLNFMELLAQNIALISPTMTAALIVPVMFATIGNVSWLGYALGTVMLLFVAFSLNQFARRTTNSGSMYSYASSGLGFTGGALCGWCLVGHICSSSWPERRASRFSPANCWRPFTSRCRRCCFLRFAWEPAFSWLTRTSEFQRWSCWRLKRSRASSSCCW